MGLSLEELVAVNASAGLNRMIGFEVVSAGGGTAALLDTACGFAAATVVGRVTASHFSMNCLRPAVGRLFVAKGTTVRAGRRQIFAKAELFAEDEQGERHLVATGETLLVSLSD